jgi:hypothetical protein
VTKVRVATPIRGQFMNLRISRERTEGIGGNAVETPRKRVNELGGVEQLAGKS